MNQVKGTVRLSTLRIFGRLFFSAGSLLLSQSAHASELVQVYPEDCSARSERCELIAFVKPPVGRSDSDLCVERAIIGQFTGGDDTRRNGIYIGLRATPLKSSRSDDMSETLVAGLLVASPNWEAGQMVSEVCVDRNLSHKGTSYTLDWIPQDEVRAGERLLRSPDFQNAIAKKDDGPLKRVLSFIFGHSTGSNRLIKLLIRSEPSGAAIHLDGRSIGLNTETTLALSLRSVARLRIRKGDHELPISDCHRSRGAGRIDYVFRCDLTKTIRR